MFAYIPDSNDGGEIIRRTTFDFLITGKERQKLKLEDLETDISSPVVTRKSDTLR